MKIEKSVLFDGQEEKSRPSWPRLLRWILCALVLTGAGATIGYAVRTNRVQMQASSAAPLVKSQIEIFELSPTGELHVAGWAFTNGAMRRIGVRVNGHLLAPVPLQIPRPDVAQAFPDLSAARTAGFDMRYAVPELARHGGLVTLALDGPPGSEVIVLAERRVGPADALTRWAPALKVRGSKPDDIFYLPLATSHVAGGGADGIRQRFGPYESATMKVGIRVQILYLRTTLGEAGDYAFDPAFRTDDKRCGKWPIAEDSLNDVIEYAVKNGMPVLFTLNGGIWADSLCDVPKWDINDRLEQDPALCQWNQHDQVMVDDYLTNQAGSYESPQLARSLSLNIYASRARHYKKRNLQQAATVIAQFAREYPDLFIGVNLDHDVYINPFFQGEQWYDYNPETLRQFREWLRGVGPYSPDAAGTTLDLTRYARAAPLSLAEVNRIARATWSGWAQVDPPRTFKKGSSTYREDPWFALWEQFRRQLVAVHYDDLARWVWQAGIPASRIYTGQGFMAPGKNSDPLASRIDSPAKNYDTGGASIEGAMPLHGHLGAILYGGSARNQIRMEGSLSLFAEFRELSGNNWAAVEFNTADLTQPKRLANFSDAYWAMRELGNYGARLVSPMAWNGSGADTSAPNFVSYTALRNTPLEDAMTQFMLQRANLPRSARLWEFGAPGHADSDGWSMQAKTDRKDRPSILQMTAGRDGVAFMESSPELDWTQGDFDRLVVAVSSDRPGLSVAVEVQAQNGAPWKTLVRQTSVSDLVNTPAGLILPIPHVSTINSGATCRIDRLRFVWHAVPGAQISVDRVALYPTSPDLALMRYKSIPRSDVMSIQACPKRALRVSLN